MITFFQKQNEQQQLDDILFAHKNKAYGAYALRHDADYFLQKALITGVALFGAVVGVSTLYLQKSTAHHQAPEPVNIRLKAIFVEEPKVVMPPVVKPQAPASAVKVKTIDYRVPEPTRNAVIEKPLPKVKALNTAAIGTTNSEGLIPKTNITPVVPTPPTGPVTAPTSTATPQPTNQVATKVDVEAEFIGGINRFRAQVAENFDQEDFSGEEGIISATVTFIVEKDGSLSAVKAEGQNKAFNAEAERAIKKIKGKWQPAKINGQAVRSYFKLPVSMQFE